MTLEGGDLVGWVFQALVVMVEQTAFAGSVMEAFLNSLQEYTVEILKEHIAEMDALEPLA